MDAAANSYRRFLDGDERAFEEIMQELFCGLVFFINGFVHDPHAAEDIAIDAFSDLVVHRHRYNFRVSLKTYLYMVGRSRALDYLRRRRILRLTELSEAHGLADDSAALEELALADDRQRRVNAALAQLPRDMAAAVRLVYFEEMTYAEAARVMGKKASRWITCCIGPNGSCRAFWERRGWSCYEVPAGMSGGGVPPQRKKNPNPPAGHPRGHGLRAAGFVSHSLQPACAARTTILSRWSSAEEQRRIPSPGCLPH